MLELVEKSLLLLGLFLCSWQDWKKQIIYAIVPGLLSVMGITLHIFLQNISIWSMLGGMLLGGALLAIGRLTKEAVGFGDGMIFVLTGIYLGFWNNLELLLLTTGMAGIVALFLLITKRRGRKDRLPMVPFVLCAYVVLLL